MDASGWLMFCGAASVQNTLCFAVGGRSLMCEKEKSPAAKSAGPSKHFSNRALPVQRIPCLQNEKILRFSGHVGLVDHELRRRRIERFV